VTFYGYKDGAAALSTCSHCFHPASTDSGGRTYSTSNLTFVDTTKRITYQFPNNNIIHDRDGTLTGLGANSYATAYFGHLAQQSECQTDMDMWTGVVCDNTAALRRIAIHGYQPGIFSGQTLWVAPYDEDQIAGKNETELADYLKDTSILGNVQWLKKQAPSKTWVAPFLTGHRYHLRWGARGLDFTRMRLTMSQRWETTDKPVYFYHNHIDVREDFEFHYLGAQRTNESLTHTDADLTGYFQSYNETAKRSLEWAMSPVNKSNPYQETTLTIQGIRCKFNC